MYFDLSHAPFGETYANSGSTDPAFTGQRQDTVSGLYDFPEREYSIQGRWTSPDPAGLAAVDPSNPQSWNRYAYVFNDPMNYVDPLGLFTCGSIWVTCGSPDPTDPTGGGGGGTGPRSPLQDGPLGGGGGGCRGSKADTCITVTADCPRTQANRSCPVLPRQPTL